MSKMVCRKPTDDDDNGFGEWGGYMDAKKQKLEQQYALAAAHNPYKQSDLFAGIAIFVNGLTTPSADELKRIMMTHGGIYHAYYRSGATTFIVADCLPDVKIRAMKASRTIIRAEWVVECVRQMRIVNYAPFLLYSGSSSVCQPKLNFGTTTKTRSAKQAAVEPQKQEDVAAMEEEIVARMCGEAEEIQKEQQPGNGIISTPITDDDDDMFSEDAIGIDDISPVVLLHDIVQDEDQHKNSKSALNASFNIADDLQFINAKLRKLPSSTSVELPAPKPAEPEQFTKLKVKLQKHPSYADLPQPNGDMTTVDVDKTSSKPSSVDPIDPQPIEHQQCTKLKVKLQKHPSYDNLPQPECADTSTAQPSVEAKPPPPASSSAVRTAVDPNFLAEFYSNSRLHHIATLGANFKNHISQLRETRDLKNFPARQAITVQSTDKPLLATNSSTIMHIDMDCFFVSVGLRSRPHFRGRPVAVTHSKGGAQSSARAGADPERERALWQQRHRNSAQQTVENRVDTKTAARPLDAGDSLAEIASCSYEARAKGLRNGMFVGAALKMCPDLCTIPYDFEAYKEVAQQLYDTVAKYTLDIEAVSCDEMYVELGPILRATRLGAEAFVRLLRAEIAALTGCPCSAGVGANRLQARMATKQAKPDGQFVLAEEAVADYFADIELRQMPGIGYSMQQKLSQFGWLRCSDLRPVTMARLQTEFGRKCGETLFQQCRGVDGKPLVFGQVRKSVSAEVNYGIRFARDEEFEAFLKQLSAEVVARLREIRRRGQSVTLKLMIRAAEAPVETAKFMGHGVCDTVSKTCALAEPSDEAQAVERAVMALRRQMGDGRSLRVEDVRGVGIQIGKLVAAEGGDQKQGESSRLRSMFAQAKPKQATTVKVNPTVKTDARIQQQAPEPLPEIPAPLQRILRNKRAISLDTPPAKRAYRKKPKVNAKDTTTVQQLFSRDKTTSVELDLAVLAELPDDIRAEALRDFRRTAAAAIRQRAANKSPSKQTKVRSPKGNKSPSTTKQPPQVPVTSDLDSDFLLALPEDIRREVLENEKRERVKKQMRGGGVTMDGVEDKESSTKPTSLDETDKTVEVVPTSSNILLTAEWKETLQQWLDSLDEHDGEEQDVEPVETDVELMSEYCVELIRIRKLADLYLRLRYLFRIVNTKGECRWHRAYLQIVRTLQVEMRLVYGAKLQATERFDCGNASCE